VNPKIEVPMKLLQRLGWFFALGLLSVSASAAEIHGVKLPDSITVEKKTLKLNGIGVRTKSIFNIKVYVAGLYLETTSSDPERIIGADGVRRLVLVMTHNAPKERVKEEFVDGFEQNSKGKLASLQARLTRLLAVISDVKDGQTMVLTYLPGKGTTLKATTGAEVTLPGKDFSDALLRAWLGSDPLDADLKAHLLGAK
jgi:hypothetical protein